MVEPRVEAVKIQGENRDITTIFVEAKNLSLRTFLKKNIPIF